MNPRVAGQPTLGQQLFDRGWSGGSVFHPDEHPVIAAIIEREIPAAAWVVVISQTCDIVARTIEQEPIVEILVCRPIEKLRSQFKNLKSTRQLDFRPNRDTHAAITVTAHATADRYHLPRDLLLKAKRDETRALSADAYKRITALYALRYTRPAWPDTFVERISAARDALIAAVDPLSDDISEVRINISPADAELATGEPYTLAIFFVIDEEVWESQPEIRRHAQRAFTAFVAALCACVDIEVNEELSGVLSGAEFTWQLTQQTQMWNFAFLSDRNLEAALP